MNNGKQPISPTMYTKFGDGEDDYKPLKDGQKTGWEVKFGGLTKREYFAGLAMQGMLSNSGTSIYLKGNIDLLVPELVSKFAIEYADELLKQLENE